MRHIFILKCLGVAAIEVTMIMSQRGNRDSNFLQAFKLAIQGPLIFTLDSPFLRRDNRAREISWHSQIEFTVQRLFKRPIAPLLRTGSIGTEITSLHLDRCSPVASRSLLQFSANQASQVKSEASILDGSPSLQLWRAGVAGKSKVPHLFACCMLDFFFSRNLCS